MNQSGGKTRDRVLEQLERNRGAYLSGEELAARLGVSRTAVWKAVGELKKKGCRVEAVTNRGYRLSQDDDSLSVEGMRPHLEREEYAGRIHLYGEVESTNRTARQMILDGAGHGQVVVADGQTQGRGRLGRQFHSPRGKGIYLSAILRPQALSVEGAPLVTTAASVAVCRAIREVAGLEAGIKWVNDVFLEGRKICGILTEAVTDFESGRVEWLILGVGINYSAAPEDFPREAREIAGSLFPGGGGPGRNALAAALLNRILSMEEWMGDPACLEEYRRRSVVLGKDVEVILPQGERYPARAVAIDGSGRLVVRSGGEDRILSAGEVSVVIH